MGGEGGRGRRRKARAMFLFPIKGETEKESANPFSSTTTLRFEQTRSRVREGEAQWLALKDSGWGGNTKRGWRDGKGGWRSGGAAHLLGRFGVPLPQFPPKLLPYRPLFYRAVTVACMRQQQAQQTSRITRRIRRSFGLLSFLFYFPLEGGGVFHAAAAAAR